MNYPKKVKMGISPERPHGRTAQTSMSGPHICVNSGSGPVKVEGGGLERATLEGHCAQLGGLLSGNLCSPYFLRGKKEKKRRKAN